MKTQASSKLKTKRLCRGRFNPQKQTPGGGPGMRPDVAQNALQMADLPVLANISKIADDDLWFFF